MTSQIATLVGATLVGLVSALVLHELGHALAAGLFGGRIERMQWRGLGARVIADLPGRRAQVAFLLAGAGANALAAGLTCALAIGAGSSTMMAAMALVSGIQSLHAALSLVPSGTNDGARLLAMWRERNQPSQGER